MTDTPNMDILSAPMSKRLSIVLNGVMKQRQTEDDPRTRKVYVFKQDDYEALWEYA